MAATCLRLLAFLVSLCVTVPAIAQAPVVETVQTTWRLLDYVGVDYQEAVSGGKIVNSLEYDEMTEFSRTISANLQSLPAHPHKAELIAQARQLQSAIAARSPPAQVAKQARDLGGRLLAAFPVPRAPSAIPNLDRGAALYAQNCASCHGVNGQGADPSLPAMDPPPIAFADRDRASERSLFGLYQVIGQGLEGTAMQSYAQLSESDRWALAFHAGGLAYRNQAEGRRIWESDPQVRSVVPDMAALVALTPLELEARLGRERAAAVTAYLRSNPQAVAQSDDDGNAALALARSRLGESLAAYANGDRPEAQRLALSAYLDGFEPVEPLLATRDGSLLTRIEQAMSAVRVGIARSEPIESLALRVAEADGLLGEAEVVLRPEASSASAAFLGAFAILVREGLEALLVVVAMLAFLGKANRGDAVRYVHGGWITALIAGAITWVAATRLISVSGQSREITEGVGALLAAVILLSVGVWMHGKAQADEWRRYIAEKMQGALSRGSAWFLFGLAFIVVYREVFETILFYAALWNAENASAVLAGGATALVCLAIIAWAMFRLSRTLPIAQFFRYSALLIAALAIVLAGKGVGALQEGGLIGITPLAGVPRLAIVGLFPTVEAVAAQVVMTLGLIFGFRSAARPRQFAAAAE